MSRSLRVLTLSALPFLICLTTTAGHAASEPSNICFSNWSDAAPIVARERLLAARDIQAMSRRRRSGEVVRITLCREDTGYVYLLLLRDDRGRISNLKIDAHGGIEAGDPAGGPHSR